MTNTHTIKFKDYPNFKPTLTPREIFTKGSFGGTYWRPIYSSITKKNYKNVHNQISKSWWKGIQEEHLSNSKYDTSVNKYKVKVGTSLEYWEEKKWITKYDPYGWVQWYCNFYNGRRTKDDERQIKRWDGIAGENGRFRKWLITIILTKKGQWNDHSISPKIRQTLQHWGYELSKHDYDNDIKYRKKTH
jgi:hypothetical protein